MTETTALALIERTLPPVWSDLWAGHEMSETFRLNSWVRPRAYFLGAAELERDVPGLTGLCPVVETTEEAIAGRAIRAVLLRGCVEGRRRDYGARQKYQEFVLSLLLELEDAGLRDEWVDFAAVLQFAHTADLIAILDREIADNDALLAFRDRVAENE